MADEWLQRKIDLFFPFALAGIGGAICFTLSYIFDSGPVFLLLFLLAFVLLGAFLVYGSLVPIWHWKRRYQGEHSELWGALLLIETTGWFKLVYWLRHIVPDYRNKGRYCRADAPAAPTQ
jgi:hypothetical protein